MVAVKVIRRTDGGVSYLCNACRYLENGERALQIGGYGVDAQHLEHTCHQMLCVRKYFHKVSGDPLIHFIISYDKSVNDPVKAVTLSICIAAYFKDAYQVIWCLHEKERENSLYHMHIVVNSVSYLDGKMFHSGYAEVSAFCGYVEKAAGCHVRSYFA